MCCLIFKALSQGGTDTTVSAFGLELFSSLEFGLPRALHLQCTVELVVQYLQQ